MSTTQLQRKPLRARSVAVATALMLALSMLVMTPTAAAADNPIVLENALPGSPASEWDVEGWGDDSIQGFATDISVNVGQTVEFKIDTTSTDYRIDIYRLGWYNGDGARKVATIDTAATVEADQPECIMGPEPENLLDCGNWDVSASWAVPAGAVSGIYIARPVRQDVGGDLASHIPFIVRDDASSSEVFFQASTTTWQSYNAYGGVNLYGYTGTTHAHKVSFNRPFQTRGTEGENYLFNAEYPMLRWMERNGYDVSYTTGIDSARRGELIQNHKVFLSVGHDEYWSKPARDAVEAARDAANPTNLAFFSANEVYWRIRWEDDYRTQVTYKEGDAAGPNEHYRCYQNFACDPTGEWTGLWRQDPDHDPENSLSGQISWRFDTVPMKVPAEYAPLRFWRNTSVSDLQPGTEETLAPGTVGYEWDPEQPEYGQFYPDGRILLSTTTIGGEQHHMSLYRAPSGALVFGAGTVQWSWGLDASPSTPNSTENRTQQQATANLLADMGALPTTLQAGLTMPVASNDNVGPTVTIETPEADAEVPGGNVVVSGTATDTGGVVAAVEVSTDDGTTWSRATGTTTWQHTVSQPAAGTTTVLVRATDDLANIGAAATRSFTTSAQVCDQANPCSVFAAGISGAEVNDPDAVELGMRFRSDIDGFITGVRFYKTVGNTGVHNGTLWSSTGANLASVTFTGETASGWQQAIFDTPVEVTANTSYVVSYHAPNGRYALGTPFNTEVASPPLRALADGTDGANGVYLYSATSSFPTSTYGSSNYLVDVLFAETAEVGPDETPPTVVARTPAIGASGVSTTSNVTATFNEALAPATVTTDTVKLRDASNAEIPASVTLDATNRIVTIDPTEALAPGTQFSVTLVGGENGITDVAGNALAADVTWSFTTASPPVDRPDPNVGPGGPVLVVRGNGSHGSYLAEILRGEGLNLFTVGSLSDLTTAGLAGYQTLVLGETTLDSPAVTAITDWVNAGGNLVAMRPDPALTGLLGLSPASGPMSEGYLQVDTSVAPGAGIANLTMQYHGSADMYTTGSDTRTVATLYSDAATATANPAVTWREVGTAGGSAAAFTFDLAESVVLTRQGNPAWVNQNRDGQAGPNRSNDLFYGNSAVDPQPDWVDLSRIAVPQADELQRLFANVVTEITKDAVPLPRLWYLPRGEKAAIVMTADNHDGGSVPVRFNQEIAASAPDCSVDDWECIRSTTYLYSTNSHLTDPETAAFQDQGFEFALHPNTNCASPTQEQFATMLAEQWDELRGTYPSLDQQRTSRNHCIAWIDWTDVPEELASAGINLDTNYYFWPPEWVANNPGVFTGSGFAQRFAALDGQLIDVYQATTQMTDESGQSYPFTADTLLDRALGTEGYYGTFVANIHNDGSTEPQNAAIIAAAQARGVPVISAEQLLEWTDGRTNSSFEDVEYADGTLSFQVAAAPGSNGLQAMLPIDGPQAGQLQQLTLDGNPVATQEQTIKGVRYLFFTAAPGSYEAGYAEDTTAPAIGAVVATPGADGAVTITWTTDEPAGSRVDYGTDPGELTASLNSAAAVTSHELTITGLAPSTTYHFRVTSADAAQNATTAPAPPAAPATFTTLGSSATDDTVAHFEAGQHQGTVVTNSSGGEVALAPSVDTRFDGDALPAGWSSTPWSAGGDTTVVGGAASVDGALLAYGTIAEMVGPGRSLESVATFSAEPFQHIGFAEDMNDVPRWAIFSTSPGDGTTLHARTNVSGGPTAVDVALPGSWIGSEHTYRIDWLTDRVVFSIDGDVVHTQLVAITGDMRPLASDFTVGGASLLVNSLQVSPPYVESGTFESRIHDAGGSAEWGVLAYDADLPVGTSLGLEVRTGETEVPDGSWSAFARVADGAEIAQTGRYLQYRAALGTSDVGVTPSLRSVTLPYDPSGTTPIEVTQIEAPTFADVAGTVGGTVTIPSVTGVQFLIDGVASDAGTFDRTAGLVTVTAVATSGYVITDGVTTSWSHTFVDTRTAATDDTVADFSAGTHDQTVVANRSGGEVTLAPAAGSDFDGTSVPAGWSSGAWNDGGAVMVADGSASVDGALLVTDDLFVPGRSLTTVATFGADNFQHLGFGVDVNDVGRWAMFSTHNLGGATLYARTNADGLASIVELPGSWVGTAHEFRIDWLADQVVFYIDGNVVHTEQVAITGEMRPLASDYNAGGPVLTVDRMTMSPFASSGTFESRIHDAGGSADWGVLAYDADLPAGTSLGLEVRVGETAVPDASWSAFAPVADGAEIAQSGRYLQYRAALGTSDVGVTPALLSVDLPYTLVVAPVCPAGEFQAEYFANTSLSGETVLVRCEPEIDNRWGTGGPGAPVPNNLFSARWSGSFEFTEGDYQFTTIADDGIRLFVDDVLLIDDWAISGEATRTAVASLSAGAHTVVVEYFENTGQATAVASWAAAEPVVCPAWTVDFYGTNDLSGDVLATECVDDVNADWGQGSPAPEIPVNNFSARYTGEINGGAGRYQFTARADDRVRVLVNGQTVIDQWDSGNANTTYLGQAQLDAGPHQVVVEYREFTGGARVEVSVTPPVVCPVWAVDFYATNDLSGSPVASACVNEVVADWGQGSPAPGIPVNNFSARYTGEIDGGAGTYQFTAKADDRVRVRVAGQTVIDQWDAGNANTTYTGQAQLDASPHEMVVEYREFTGGARVEVSVTPPVVCPVWAVDFYASNDLSGNPVASACVEEVNQDWGRGSPAPGVPENNFSARYTSTVNGDAGTYQFTARADDRVRVVIEGQTVINQWDAANVNTTYTGQAQLGAGPHLMVVEYREFTGAARVLATATAP